MNKAVEYYHLVINGLLKGFNGLDCADGLHGNKKKVIYLFWTFCKYIKIHDVWIVLTGSMEINNSELISNWNQFQSVPIDFDSSKII